MKNGIGSRIRKRRLELGMSQEALGALVGIQKSGVHKVEAELVNVSATSLSKYARALQCDESWLLS